MTDTLRERPDLGAAPGVLMSVVYVSTATVEFSELDLALLLAVSRRNNEARGLTGVLLFQHGQFIQVLEGPEASVRAALATIASDPRHTGVRVLAEELLPARHFGSWAMGYRSLTPGELEGAPAWFGSPEAFITTADRRAEEVDSPAEELLNWFRRR
jgi:hypothetical protein